MIAMNVMVRMKVRTVLVFVMATLLKMNVVYVRGQVLQMMPVTVLVTRKIVWVYALVMDL